MLLPAALCLATLTAQTAARKPAPASSAQVRRWMASLSLDQRIAQLIILPFFGDNPGSQTKAYGQFADQVRHMGIGGLILINRVRQGAVQNAEPLATAAFLNRMQKLARIPLIVGGDFERGISMRISGATRYPHQMAFAAARDPDATRRMAAATARESRAVGVHWVFAPVADVNNNPDNPIINIRAFSEDPKEVATHVKAYLEGARSDPNSKVLVTVKHFPGHGDTSVDTHLGLGKVEGSRQRLAEMELVPFQAAIASGVDSVMTAHLWVPAIDTREVPATVSPAVLTNLLRKELGFSGLVTTDAMDMQGLSGLLAPGEAAVRALEAGADVLLMPARPVEAMRAIRAAVEKGRIHQRRIDESVERILAAKVRLGLHKKRFADLEALSDALDREEDRQLAQRIADKAVTLVRNEGQLTPIEQPERSCWYMLIENRHGQQGIQMSDFLEQRLPTAKRWLLDSQMSRADLEAARRQSSDCGAIVVAAYAGFRGTGALPDGFTWLVESLSSSGQPLILVGLGNPYLLRAFAKVPAFLATFSTVPPSEIAAVKAILGDIAISGSLPVTIPGIARYGDGLKVAAKTGGNLTQGPGVR